MKMDAKFHPELCASKDEQRAAILDPELDVERKAIIATNGHVIVSVPVTVEEGDTSGMVSRRALAEARAEAKEIRGEDLVAFDSEGCGPVDVPGEVIGHEPLSLKANGACVLDSGITVPRKREMPFPEWQRVLPVEQKLTGRLCFSATLLKSLADAIGAGSGQVTLDFNPADSTSPMVVRAAHPGLVYESEKSRIKDESFGVLMPVKLPKPEGAR